MTHHSCQDFAAMCGLTGMRVYDPSDRFQTRKLIEALYEDNLPAYIRVSRNPGEDVYDENMPFTLNKANVLGRGKDVLLISCGELVPYAKKAMDTLNEKGISCGLIDMYCIKPYDEETLLEYAKDVKLVVSVEEHGPNGGLGAKTAQVLCHNMPKKLVEINLPDEHLISGTNHEMFAYYGLDDQGIVKTVLENL